MGTQTGADNDRAHTFCIDVRDVTLRRALSYVGSSIGWNELSGSSGASAVVCDATGPHGGDQSQGLRILVIEPTPKAADYALEAVRAGRVHGIFASDRPDDLPPTLESAMMGRITIPASLVRLGQEMPSLTERQVQIIESVICGKNNAQIATELFLSPASIKRELGELFRLLDVPNRASLAGRGRELGIRGNRLV